MNEIDDPSKPPERPKPRRRWFRFSLRTLVILVVLLSLAFGWIGRILVRVRHQRAIVAHVEARGGRVMYDYQLAQTNGPFVNSKAVPPGPPLVRFLFGDDVLAHVEDVGFMDFDQAITDEDIEKIIELPRLKDVWISDGGGVTDKGIEQLARVRDLRTLILTDAGVTPGGLAPIGSKSSLRSLTFHGPWINDESLQALSGLPELNELSLTRANITSSGVSNIARMKTLRVLYVREIAGFDDAAMNEIAQLDHLESLTLRDTSVTDDGFRALANLKELKELWVSHTPVSDKGIAHLAGLQRLATLQLNGDRIGDDALEVVSRLKSLKTLLISGTNITDQGLRHAVAMTNLRSLSLSNTNVSDAGLVHLARLHNLKELTLGTAVTERGAKQLKKALPECEILLCDKDGACDHITAD